MKADVIRVYRCEGCDTVHEYRGDAESCCPQVETVWQCSHCEKTYVGYNKAVACCHPPIRDSRCLCGNDINDEAQKDSKLVGHMPRCTDCLRQLGIVPVEEILRGAA